MERKWDALEVKLSDEILKTLKKLKFSKATPVQVIYHYQKFS